MKNYIAYLFFSILLIIGFGCDRQSESPSTMGIGDTNTGKGGSLARFAIAGDYLYTVDQTNLRVFNVAVPGSPDSVSKIAIGNDIETIYPYNDNLFIGSETGMHIYSLANPKAPNKLSTYSHIRSCDPVVVEGNTAYVTLNASRTRCWGGLNSLDIINITSLTGPTLIRSYSMTAPGGLGVDDTTLFVCDVGLKVYNVKDPNKMTLIQQFTIDATDVIPLDGKLLVIGTDGFYQYSYSGDTLKLLSSIPVIKK